MDFSISELAYAMPEIFLLFTACVILIVDVCLPERLRYMTYALIQGVLGGAFLLALLQFKEYPEPIYAFSGHFVIDKLAVLSKLTVYLFSFFAFAYARDYIRSRNIADSEYYLLGLFAVIGMSVMASANTFLTIYLGLELLSLALYAMVAMYKDSNDAVESAMKFFVLGSFASGLLLYGISLLYGLTGSLELHTVATVLADRHDAAALAAMVFVIAGLIFKFGAVPFHMWVPDVYQGSPTATTLFIASAPKIAAFAITVRILQQSLPGLQESWVPMLIVISIASMLFGNLVAIAQSNIKRMFAYSSIAHVGYALLGILAGPNSTNGYSAAMFYIVTYVLVVAGAFAVVAMLSRHGVEFDKLDDYRGLNARNPWLAFMMLLLLFSMAGVPPTVGFFAKLGLLESVVQAGYVWLAAVALIFALVGVYYYLRVVMLMYFDEPSPEHSSRIHLSSRMLAAISLNGSAALILGVLPSFTIDLCRISLG
ncbi:MAG TPA: NADH-quinone oxidoreductase subunit NuoN [Gammaproteobacteria bacterium]|nr:NADH-quinone oxidoreductase subunit NuoN [Gammaproteobacteria bacterium]